MPMFSAATAADVEEMTALWREAFDEDTAEDIASFLKGFLDTAYVAKVDDRAVSMLFLLPAFVWTAERLHPVGYIYAGATAAAYRGQGLYRRLLAFVAENAKQSGLEALFLRPADEALAQSYRRMGYTVPLFTCKNSAAVVSSAAPVEADAFMREKHARLSRGGLPHVVWSDRVIAYLQTYTAGYPTQDGGLVLMTQDGNCPEYVWAEETASLQFAGLLYPLCEGDFTDCGPIYMGYGLE